jgi:hypothetical protein
LFDFLETDSLPRKDGAEINFLAVETDTPAAGDVDGLVVERIIKFGQAAIGTDGGSIDFRGALHVEGLVRPLVVGLRYLPPFHTSSPVPVHTQLDSRFLRGFPGVSAPLLPMFVIRDWPTCRQAL